MKKFVKMSLVAAVAVAGLTSANAKPLTEAIQDVDVSGTVVYRYQGNDNDVAGTDNSTTNYYKIGLNLSSKVNDDVKLNTRFLVSDPSATGTGDGGFATLDSSDNGDQNVGVELSTVNFAYTGIANTTVIAGKQGLTTPWTVAVDSDSNEQTGTGLLALSNLGPVTVAAAYFNQTNLNISGDVLPGIGLADTQVGGADVSAVAVIVPVGPVTLDAWYLDMQDIFDTYTFGANAKFDVSGIKLGVDARYTELTLDDWAATALHNSKDSNSLAKIVLTADAGLIDAKLAYAMSDSDGGIAALDNDATTSITGWNINGNNKMDLDYYQVVVGVDALENLNISANYGNAQYKSTNVAGALDIEEEEVYVQAVYNMSKNLSTYVRYGTYTKDTGSTENNDDVRGRLQIQYSF
ncbi:MAG: porin [Candidatus Marinarcus sp.]|uniref:porin n=1 Tax=Candidatus Marinarcus sp. TaxID=3100987 RepID=UPI003B002E45